jgi:hypothetical protein
MFKKKDEAEPAPASPAKKKPKDEHAYEDAWYRALKAQSERPADADEDGVEDAAEG